MPGKFLLVSTRRSRLFPRTRDTVRPLKASRATVLRFVCQEEEDWETIEKRLGCGQVEELIEEVRDELTYRENDRPNVCSLPCWATEWDPWGVPDDYECEVIENDAPVPKHVPLHRPGPLPEEFYKTLEAVSKKDEPRITSGELQIKE
ncbi:putative NADH dehydrogenase 1 alpha subcomplex subunit 5 [Hibiscus syriacus]|uniref:NADH dehydrogenase 1 alpha subcomplex subunit 5 n=1 Tax=Hibiscus syriacus TaxID=106335 RepID=A0A6A2X2D2_HIBSY|nr:putative NADH dehydrogenase 1 alpha subcomplex subunit 5 [Hibiscus syriacus]